ncbi:ribosomal protein bS6 [Cardinium endosymbiont of Sogatella furcifera]|uniref:30S ribosomal protein S6 n=1 Tax=Cardinium endosymbiont of Sogatella furcifera TaxID=650378 RepID=UPI000E0CC3A9|nr:30S ribosomal protein S6 [Cardinium endosymbiont of Sogatella furcifera]AXI24101.1 ribosomal protein bS6 [Cardinium endosymbiont of Sogatella furcifera]
MRHYETVFILSPVLSNDQIKASINKYRSFLMERNAAITHEEEIGLKPLAYQIKHKKRGVYHLIEFTGDPSLIQALEVAYARDEEVLRFLTFALDKHGLAHNMARRSDDGINESKKAVAL